MPIAGAFVHAPAMRHLAACARELAATEHARIADLAAAVRRSAAGAAEGWIAASRAAKGWTGLPASLGEEWATGPLPVARFLHLVERLHRDLHRSRAPAPQRLPQPAADGSARWSVPAAPGLADPLLLRGIHAELHTAPDAAPSAPARTGGLALVLGAGNVTATPVLDVLHQVFLLGRAAVLKLSPLHRTLHPHLSAALQPLIDAGLALVLQGDGALGAALSHVEEFDAVHLTGSATTWQRLREDPALAKKQLTAEVGCTTPVLVVPGPWRAGELQHAARELAGFCASNGGALCLAPRVLLTARDWPQRSEFLQALLEQLAALPARAPFHPSAREHFERAAGSPAPERLPPTLRSGLELPRDAALLRSEHFAPVLLELPLPGADPAAWLDGATGTARDELFGSLSAYVVAPPAVRTATHEALDRALVRLPHGTIAINTWTGLGYGLGSVPWGAPATAPVEHGRGTVHGTLGLPARRTVLEAPFRPHPLPPWSPAHRAGAATVRAAARFTFAPSPLRLLAVAANALRSP